MFKTLFGNHKSKNEGASDERLKMLQKLNFIFMLLCTVFIGMLLIFSIFAVTPLKDERIENINQTTNAVCFEVKSIPFSPSHIELRVDLVNTDLRADFRLADEENKTLLTSRDSFDVKPNKYYLSLNTESGKYYLLIENITNGAAGERIDLQKQSVQVHYVITINFLVSLYPYLALLFTIVAIVMFALLYRTRIMKKSIEVSAKKAVIGAEPLGEGIQEKQQPQIQSGVYPTSYGPSQQPTQTYYPQYPQEAYGEQYYPPEYQYAGDTQGYYPPQTDVRRGDEDVLRKRPKPTTTQPPSATDRKREKEKKEVLSEPPKEIAIKQKIGEKKGIDDKTQRREEKPIVVKCQLCGFENEVTKSSVSAGAKCQLCGHALADSKPKQTF